VEERRRTDRKEWNKGIIALAIFTAVLAVPPLVALLAPQAMWYVDEGWRYKNLEPSAATLALVRVGGGLLLLLLAVFWVMVLRNRQRS
jgi:hypothetical protein